MKYARGANEDNRRMNNGACETQTTVAVCHSAYDTDSQDLQ